MKVELITLLWIQVGLLMHNWPHLWCTDLLHQTIIAKLLESLTDGFEVMVELGGFKTLGNRQVIHILKESFKQRVHAVEAGIDVSMERIEQGQHNGQIGLLLFYSLSLVLLFYCVLLCPDTGVGLGMLT